MREASLRQAFVAAVAFATVPFLAFAAEPGERFRHCADCPEMVVVPAGEFVMGSPSDEPGHSEIEEPRHRAAIRRPLAIGRTEVTYAEWGACAADGGCNGLYLDAAVGGARPVVQVSWNDAIAYTVWLSSKVRARYRLMSETEWEYAARAGSTGSYHWQGRPVRTPMLRHAATIAPSRLSLMPPIRSGCTT